MPTYFPRLVNAGFESCAETEFALFKAAVRAGLEGGKSIARESVLSGEQATAVEVRIEQDGRTVNDGRSTSACLTCLPASD